MSEKVIDYYLSVNSPWSYLGAARLVEIAGRAGRRVNTYPTQFLEVFSQTGGLPLPKRSPERQAYRLIDMARWRDYLEIPINIEPAHFPADDTLAAYAIIGAQVNGLDALALSLELGRAQWELDQDFSHMGTIAAAASRAGINVADLGELAQYAEQFSANTQQAMSNGAFGFPSYIVDGELFWGQDRLEFLERKLSGEQVSP